MTCKLKWKKLSQPKRIPKWNLENMKEKRWISKNILKKSYKMK
jgi:hypothetical protein